MAGSVAGSVAGVVAGSVAALGRGANTLARSDLILRDRLPRLLDWRVTYAHQEYSRYAPHAG